MRCKRSRCNSSFYPRINDQRQGCPDRKSVLVLIGAVRGTNFGLLAVRTSLIKGIIPHMEREGYKLAEIIQNRKALHRSLFSATRKLFGSGNSKSGQLSGGFSNWYRLNDTISQWECQIFLGSIWKPFAEKYSESVDIQIRKLADLQFLMQQARLKNILLGCQKIRYFIPFDNVFELKGSKMLQT